MIETTVCNVEKSNTKELVIKVQKGKTDVLLRLTHGFSHCWRLQSAVSGVFDDRGAAQTLATDLEEPLREGLLPFSHNEGSDVITVSDGEDCIRIVRAPFSIQTVCGAECCTTISGVVECDEAFTICGTLSEGEALFGSGERFNCANQRGKQLEMMAIDRWCQTEGNSYVPVPIVMSSKGYALFLNRYERSTLDLGAKDQGAWVFTQYSAPLDLYLFMNRNPLDTLYTYSLLTGFSPMPASWLFGIQSTRHERLREYGTVAGISEMIRKMEENNLPWDAIVIEGWRTYDVSGYAELKRAADMVHALGKKIMVYSECGRVPYSDDPEQQKEIDKQLLWKPEYLLREPDGQTKLPETATYNPADMPNPRRSQFLDLTNPKAMHWWFDLVWGRLVKEIGIDGSKIDFCEQVPDHLPLKIADGRKVAGIHQWYPTLYNARMYRYFEQNRPDGGMCLSRGGGIGAQRYPFLWAGDQLREWRFLQAILTSILSAGLSGIPFMSCDLAAYLPSENPGENPEEQVFLRGAQMGCFSSNMQTHGTVTRPYDFETPVKDIYRVYCRLHQALRPYLLEQAQVACRTGTPLMRHLFLYDPQDPNVYHLEDEYLLGDALLIAPVLTGAKNRDIYLPAGRWTGLFDKVTFNGPCTLEHCPVPVQQIPVFVREGHTSKVLVRIIEESQVLIEQLQSL